jgi:integrase
MKSWPNTDGEAIDEFVRERRLRLQGTRARYARVLGGFQDFVVRRGVPPRDVGRSDLEAWLRKGRAQWTKSTFFLRARIVCRFLEFLARHELIACNPVAALQAEYCIRCSQTIVRALVAADSDAALEALRQFPPFGSVLGQLMRDHVALMRTRGYRYHTQAQRFLRFDRFLQAHPELAAAPIEIMMRRWRAAHSTLWHAAECEQLGRQLAKARRHLDPGIELPRQNGRPQQQLVRQWRRPHIYSPEEIRRLLDIALAYPSPRAPLRPLTLYTMIALGYCAGLRVSEIAHLDLRDVDLQSGAITIRETKFFKSRILPLTDSVVAALREYLDARRRAGAPQDPDSGLFWHERAPPARYHARSAAAALVDVIRRAGLKPAHGKTGPRIHDLRHSMVVNRITAWYRAGVNPQDKLAYLATYLGHRDINSTLVYITVTQDLLQEAGERFRRFGAHHLQAAEGGLS